jgi:hypothetical protein
MANTYEALKEELISGKLDETQLRQDHGLVVYPDPEGDHLITGPDGKPRRAQLSELEPADFQLVPRPIGTAPDKTISDYDRAHI